MALGANARTLSRVSISLARSLVPERFRGGCSFGGSVPSQGPALKGPETLSRAVPCRLPDIDAASCDAAHNLSQSRVWGGVKKSAFAANHTHHPGEGRGPVGKVVVTADRPTLLPSPNWAPAFAGVVSVVRCTSSN